MRFFFENIGVCAPGMPDWSQARDILSGTGVYVHQPIANLKPDILPPNERRRMTKLIKLAMEVASEAMRTAEQGLDNIPNVFASSVGDAEITDRICRALTEDEKPVSPTQFHNSVHNAPAGYWSIATGSMQNSVSLSAYNASFTAGLLEAVTMLGDDHDRVLLVAYDVTPPEPLLQHIRVTESFAVAMLLSTNQGRGAAIEIVAGGEATVCDDAELESLRVANPAARSLPLLQALVGTEAGEVFLPYVDGQLLKVQVDGNA